MILWIESLLAYEELKTGSTVVFLNADTKASPQSIAQKVIQARATQQHSTPTQVFRIAWQSYQAWRRNKTANPYFAQVRDMNWADARLQKLFTLTFALELPGPMPTCHHNIVVHMVRLGMLQVRAFTPPNAPEHVCACYVAFRTHRWTKAIRLVRLLEFMLLRNLLNQRPVEDVICTVVDREESEAEYMDRVTDTIDQIESLPVVQQMDTVERAAFLAPHRNRMRRGVLDGSQQVALWSVGSLPCTLVTGDAGSGKTHILNHLHFIPEVIVSSNVRATVLAQATTVRTVAPTSALVERLNNMLPASTCAYLETYAKHNNERTLGLGTSTAPSIESRQRDVCVSVADEVGMVDTAGALSMLEQTLYSGQNSSLVLLADAAQLSAVGPGGLLRDALRMPELAVIRCAENHRVKGKEHAEAASKIARIGDAYDPTRVSIPHVPCMRAWQALVDKCIRGDIFDPLEDRYIDASHQPWESGWQQKLQDNLLEFKRRIAILRRLAASSPAHRKALAPPVVMSKSEAKHCAIELGDKLADASALARTRGLPPPAIELREMVDTNDEHKETDMRLLARMQASAPDSVQLLAMQHSTNHYFNCAVLEEQKYKQPSGPMPNFLALGMKLYSKEKISSGLLEIARNVAFMVVQVYVVDHANQTDQQPRWDSPMPPQSTSIQLITQTTDARDLVNAADGKTQFAGARGQEMIVLNPLNEYASTKKRYVHLPVTSELMSVLGHASGRTIHASQGTDVDEVIVVLDESDSPTVYTAVTRARLRALLLWAKRFAYDKHRRQSAQEAFVRQITTKARTRLTAFGWCLNNRSRFERELLTDVLSEAETSYITQVNAMLERLQNNAWSKYSALMTAYKQDLMTYQIQCKENEDMVNDLKHEPRVAQGICANTSLKIRAASGTHTSNTTSDSHLVTFGDLMQTPPRVVVKTTLPHLPLPFAGTPPIAIQSATLHARRLTRPFLVYTLISRTCREAIDTRGGTPYPPDMFGIAIPHGGFPIRTPVVRTVITDNNKRLMPQSQQSTLKRTKTSSLLPTENHMPRATLPVGVTEETMLVDMFG
jgi:hypothetical protein